VKITFIIFLFLPALLFSQSHELKGVLLDQVSRAPVPNAHLKIRGTAEGTITGRDGVFKLAIRSLPSTIDVSCIGYENFAIEFSTITGKLQTCYIKPATYLLEPVTVTDKPAVALFKDEDYTMLNYAFLDDCLILIVFRNQLKHAEIVLMTTTGDTLSVTPVPSSPALCLYQDVFSNIHYITKRNEAFQAEYDPVLHRLDFPFRTTYDTLKMFLGGYRFVCGDRLWFQENSPHGFLTSIGYYSRQEGKRKISRSMDLKGMNIFYSDAVNYHTDCSVLDPIDEFESRKIDADATAYRQFYWKKGCGELFMASDTTLAFFNFCGNRIELLDRDGRPVRVTTIDFHHETTEAFLASLAGSIAGSSEWRWNQNLVQDEAFRNIYAIYSNKGFLRLKKIDLTTGKLTASASLPYEFPEKIKVFKGEVYFLYRGPGERENRKLYKMILL
jgi:hypothetical protein